MEGLKKIKTLLPVVVAAGLVVAFFWKFFFKGLVPIPADITTGMYFPWLDYKWGFEVGVPVKNAILSDVVSVLYPIKMLAIEMIKLGKFPLWNPYMFSGYPLLANFQIGIFNPINILHVFLPNAVAWSWQVVLQPVAAAGATFIFLRYLKLNRWASLLGGVIYAFSGFSIMWLEWNAHGWTAALLPLLLLLTDKFYQHRQAKVGFILSLTMAFQIFAGYPQLVMYSFGAMGLLVLWRHGIWQKTTIKWLGYIVLGIAITGVQLLPSAELLSISQRQREVLEPETATLTWTGLITLLAPDFFGNHSTLNFWGAGNYTTNVAYSGVVTLIVAMMAFIYRRKEFWVRYFLTLMVASLLFALPTPFSHWFQQLKGLGLAAASSTRILFLVNFSLAAGVAFGFDLMLTRKVAWGWLRAIYLPLIILMAFVVATGVSFLLYRGGRLTVGGYWGTNNLVVGLRNLVFPLVFTVSCSLLLLAANVSRRFKNLVMIGIFGLIVIELFRFGWKYLAFSQPRLLFPTTPVIEFLKRQPGIFRVEGGDAIPVNMWLAYGLESMAAYDAVYPLRTAEYIAAINSGSIQKPQGRHGTILKYNSRLLDIANVCYLLAVKRNLQSKPDFNGTPDMGFQQKKLVTVFEDKRVVVLENKDCLPRAWVATDYEIKSGQEIINRLVDPNFNPRLKVILESEPGVTMIKEQKNRKENIAWEKYEANGSELLTETDTDGFLVVSDSFYPGWKAEIDGKPIKILRANYNFRAIFLPSGKHRVKFDYEPVWLKVGAGISMLSLASFAILLVHECFGKHKSARTSTTGVLSKSDKK